MNWLGELSVGRYLDDILKEDAQLIVSGADFGKSKDTSMISKRNQIFLKIEKNNLSTSLDLFCNF